MNKIKRVEAVIMILAIIIGSLSLVPVNSLAASKYSMSGKAHVQTYGDVNATIRTDNGIETLVLGTRGEAKRVESITINFTNNTGYSGTMQYRVHRQSYGWTDWINAGSPAGTTGEAKRLEAIEIRLTGELKNHYSVRYAAHAQTYGDNQGWVYNGALAGTTGEAKRLEEIRVQILPTFIAAEQVFYRVHRQTYGWESTWNYAGMVSGTTGQAKRLEGISIDLKGNEYTGGITYRTHVQSYGWLDWVSDGRMSGTQGEAKRLEAIEIKLTGDMENKYDVYYRVHAQQFGWMGWAKNGESAGTAGYAYRLEAIQVVLVKKGIAAPAATYKGVTQNTDISYNDKSNEGRTWHPAEYKQVWVVDTPAWSEEVPVYETVYYDMCNQCKKKFYHPDYYIKKYGYYDEDDPEMDPGAHLDESVSAMQRGETERVMCWSYSTGFTEYIIIGTETINYPEEGHWEQVLVKEGYWE